MYPAPVESWLDELTTFLLSRPTEEEIIAFKPSEALSKQFKELLDRNREGELARFERSDLHDFLNFELILKILKAKAELKIATEKSQPLGEFKFDEAAHNALYHIPIEVLSLSEETLHIARSIRLVIVGDWVDLFVRIGNGVIGAVHPDDLRALITIQDEVKRKLAEHGYGTFD
jgi:hypothetical protein